MVDASRPATVDDIHDTARAMPHVTVDRAGGRSDNPVYQVGGKPFVSFRNPRPDAADPETGQRYDDVIVIWVADDHDKQALVHDESRPYFTTDHFNGHSSVLLRGSRIGEIPRQEIVELIQNAWLCRASKRRAAKWLDRAESGPSG